MRPAARQGLCIHLGCGRANTPGLIAQLARNSGFLAKIIALDEALSKRAHKAIDAKGMAGRADRKADPPFNPLPYLNDLARVVVVENFAALAAQGLTKEEILRVTSPNGFASWCPARCSTSYRSASSARQSHAASGAVFGFYHDLQAAKRTACQWLNVD